MEKTFKVGDNVAFVSSSLLGIRMVVNFIGDTYIECIFYSSKQNNLKLLKLNPTIIKVV